MHTSAFMNPTEVTHLFVCRASVCCYLHILPDKKLFGTSVANRATDNHLGSYCMLLKKGGEEETCTDLKILRLFGFSSSGTALCPAAAFLSNQLEIHEVVRYSS